ncbi:hypothetical protein [Reyranella sp. CPCC 100927]|uniref:hypothetical protein n=1 Tax=Reyranella sp. CPCC 100927 TaxID=2599616 RepID=UPI0011B389DC|nr:hypothetical protein [Reyranella sp. CPCC 100927]TWS97075.1 hypothetical protein FQU96_38055 [Reyranella sp. CPCC 100927]
MALSISSWAEWMTSNKPVSRTVPVIALGSGDSTESSKSWIMLSEQTTTQLDVETFMKGVNHSKKISLFMRSDAALLAFPVARKVHFLQLTIKADSLLLSEQSSHDLTVWKNAPWTVKGPRIQGNNVSVASFGVGSIVVFTFKGTFKS